MNWSDFALAVSTGAVPVTIWLAFDSLQHQKRLDAAHQIGLGISLSSVDDKSCRFTIEIKYSGFAPLHDATFSVVNGLEYVSLGKSRTVHPGEQFLHPDLALPSRFQDAFLHATWTEPRRGVFQKGVRYQAVRVSQDGIAEQWRWRLFERIRRRFDHPLGRWKIVKKRRHVPSHLPGWPVGTKYFQAELRKR